MRRPLSDQTRLDCQTIPDVQLNLKCRDEIIPILAGLQYIYLSFRTSCLNISEFSSWRWPAFCGGEAVWI
jgi:hypothetical protein